MKSSDKPVIGWREWVALPALEIAAVKAKIDTGARSSTLHAFDVQVFHRGNRPWVRFKVFPYQRNRTRTIEAEAALVEYRNVRSSTGHETSRPVIVTPVELFGRRWDIELTLVNRDAMGFRMLLGRQALKGLIIDPAKSYRAGKGPRRKKKTKKATKGRGIQIKTQ